MPILTVSEERFSGGREFAETLAKRLNLRLIDSNLLIERAAAWGADPEKLRAALDNPPNLLDRFTHHCRIQVCLLQAALAERGHETVVADWLGSDGKWRNLARHPPARIVPHQSRRVSTT